MDAITEILSSGAFTRPQAEALRRLLSLAAGGGVTPEQLAEAIAAPDSIIAARALTATLTEDVEAGDWICLTDDVGGVLASLAHANAEGFAADGFVEESGLNGATITVRLDGLNRNASPVGDGNQFLSLVPGKCMDTTDPDWTDTVEVVQYVGKAVGGGVVFTRGEPVVIGG